MRYLVQPRDQIFVKGYEYLSFAKNMGKNIGKNISKNLSDKYSQKIIDHAKISATNALKTSSKRFIQKITETTGDFVGNQMANRITKLQEIHNKIIRKQLQPRMIKKYQKKDKFIYIHIHTNTRTHTHTHIHTHIYIYIYIDNPCINIIV